MCNRFFLSASIPFIHNWHVLFLSGASSCVKLNLFEEAINWCDQGLAVSLDTKQI